jgi:hypothetical protein
MHLLGRGPACRAYSRKQAINRDSR